MLVYYLHLASFRLISHQILWKLHRCEEGLKSHRAPEKLTDQTLNHLRFTRVLTWPGLCRPFTARQLTEFPNRWHLLLPWDADWLKTSCDRSTCHKLQARCMVGYKLRVSGVQWAVARSHKPTNKPPRSCQSDETAHSNEKWPFHRIIWLYTHSEFTGFLFEENIMILMTSTCLHDFAFWQKLLNPIY